MALFLTFALRRNRNMAFMPAQCRHKQDVADRNNATGSYIMTLNRLGYFKRRKILKNANFLDLTPVRLHRYESRDDRTVSILVPRFSGWLSGKILQPLARHSYISVSLDELGSATWLLCNGKNTVRKICEIQKKEFGQKIYPAEERITTFLSQLYKDKMLSFTEVLDRPALS